MPFSVRLQDRTMQNLLALLGVGSVCGLGPDLVGVDSISLDARYRTAACSNTLNQGLEKIQAARADDFASVVAHSPIWEKDCRAPSTSRNTLDAFNIVCRLDRDGKLDEASRDKKQKVATGFIRDKLHTQDFAGPISLRASKVLGPISRYRIADVLPHMKLASRASRPGLTVGFSAHPLQRATPSPTTTNALFCMIYLFLFGDRLLCFHGQTIFSTT